MTVPSSSLNSDSLCQPAALSAARVSGQTAACRSLYSASRSLRTFRTKQTLGGSSHPLPRCPFCSRDLLEVEIVDVVVVEDQRRAEHDLTVGLERELAEFTRGEGFPLRTGDLPGLECGAGVAGQVAEVVRVPQRALVDSAVLDELAHLVRGTQSGDGHFTLVLGVADVAGRGGQSHGGR